MSAQTSVTNLAKAQTKYAKMFDPPIPGQAFCLVSFKLPPDATRKISGAFKVRGCFSSEEAAVAYAKEIINEVDNLHEIKLSHVGSWMPISEHDEFNRAVEEIVVTEVEKAEEDMRVYRETEKEKIKRHQREIMQREQELREDVKKDAAKDDLNAFVMNYAKKTQLEEYINMIKGKLAEYAKKLAETTKTHEKLVSEHPEYLDQGAQRMREIETSMRGMNLPTTASSESVAKGSETESSQLSIMSSTQ